MTESAPRMPVITDAAASPDAERIFAGAGELLAFVSNFARTATHVPWIARWAIPMVAAIQRGGSDATVDVRVKELAILRTSTRNKCFFCTQHNIKLGRIAELTDDEIEAVSGEDPAGVGLFAGRDLAAITWADRVTRNEAHADPEALEQMRSCFTDEEFVELTMAACLFNFLNRFNDTMWLELDDGAPAGAQLHIDPKAFRRYAEAMYPAGADAAEQEG